MQYKDMKDPKTIERGNQLLSDNVYFVDRNGTPLRPIFQKDKDTGIHSYRVYVNGGNKKDEDIKIQCHKELARYLIDGHSVRCKVQSGESSNRQLNSRDVAKLMIELENA